MKMIDLLFRVLDLLRGLKEARDQRVRRLFDEFFKPIYTDLEAVNSDYLDMFGEVRNMLPKRETEEATVGLNNQLVQAAEFLRKRRLQLATIRVKLQEVVRELRGEAAASQIFPNCPEADEFIETVSPISRRLHRKWALFLQNYLSG
jgi:hypothetical protein